MHVVIETYSDGVYTVPLNQVILWCDSSCPYDFYFIKGEKKIHISREEYVRVKALIDGSNEEEKKALVEMKKEYKKAKFTGSPDSISQVEIE